MRGNLKVQDLRLGNLIHAYVGFFGRDEVVSVTAIGEHISDIRHTATSVGATSANMGGYYPIPLTEEWLVKFGFKQFRTHFYLSLNSDGFPWSIEYFNGEIAININDEYSNLTCAKYVHQLQNLYFALTGEELIMNG